ncbi:E3 ubiquitin- ligase TRIM71-like [Brachionus plicatilis]|uniref:E3 ubiquitin-ligase TRIM71-like n=1 Tax=Brachionus plicatilis TaxID=10195 RepID=A0A3M7QYS4_BRAPC|nr:E3 ubiquitin- ligase TRIM71-like [Brachionus plicatilis]
MNSDELFEAGLNTCTQRPEKEKFYKASIIRDYLICPSCDQPFVNPLNLPCSHNICSNCFKSLKNEYPADVIKCPVCQTENSIPPTGFPINTMIVDLLEFEPVEIRRGSHFERLIESTSQILVDLNGLIGQLNDKIINGEANIRRFCVELREQVNYSTNKKIDQLNQNREIFFGRINDFQNKCLSDFLKREPNLKDMLDKCLFDVDEWKLRVQAPQNDESDVENVKLLADNLKQKLSSEIFKFDLMLFGNQRPKFIEDNNQLVLDSIGQIVNEKIQSEEKSDEEGYETMNQSLSSTIAQ